MPRQPNDDAHENILKNFSIDEEDEQQLGTGQNEDNIEFDDDDEVEEINNKKPDVEEGDDDDDDATEPVAAKPKDEEDDKNDRFAFKEDRQGNFIDKDGNVIVRRGKQRDIFVKIKKAWQREQKQKNEITTQFQETVAAAKELLGRYNTLKAEKNVAESLGLTPVEAKQAAEIMAQMKLDPKAGIRKILTMVHLNGTDLSDMGVTGPVDAQTVARHMLEMQEAGKPKEKSPEDKAREEVEGFLGRHPDAAKYSGVLAEAKRRFPVMTYDQLWIQLLLHQKQKNEKPSKDEQQQRPLTRTFPRNSQRDTGSVDRQPNGKLSLKAVDPSQSFSQIGRDLLRDIKQLEKG